MKFQAVLSPARRQVLQGAFALVAAPSAWGQGAASYPQRQVRIVVPHPTGGSNDVLARILADKLQGMWAQPVVVENKPGAAGNIGSAEVAKAPADGHTLLITNINITSMNPALVPQMPFNPDKDFTPVTLLGTTSLVLVVHPSVPVSNTAELLEYLRSRQGKLSYASGGNGSPQHMLAEMFKSNTGTRIVHIPHRGAAPALTDLVGGQVDLSFAVINQVLPLIGSGRVRALAGACGHQQQALAAASGGANPGGSRPAGLRRRNLVRPRRPRWHADGGHRPHQRGRAECDEAARDRLAAQRSRYRRALKYAYPDAAACRPGSETLERDHQKRWHQNRLRAQ